MHRFISFFPCEFIFCLNISKLYARFSFLSLSLDSKIIFLVETHTHTGRKLNAVCQVKKPQVRSASRNYLRLRQVFG